MFSGSVSHTMGCGIQLSHRKPSLGHWVIRFLFFVFVVVLFLSNANKFILPIKESWIQFYLTLACLFHVYKHLEVGEIQTYVFLLYCIFLENLQAFTNN